MEKNSSRPASRIPFRQLAIISAGMVVLNGPLMASIAQARAANTVTAAPIALDGGGSAPQLEAVKPDTLEETVRKEQRRGTNYQKSPLRCRTPRMGYSNQHKKRGFTSGARRRQGRARK
jgi:hypothetical protein